ncbi:MAG: DUF1772 domain-containing protein [Caulobacteraceae bacterium]
MFAGQLALSVAAIFAGAAIYVTVAEQPARLALDDVALLAQWKPSYKRGYVMQATLAIVGFFLGLVAWWQTRNLWWVAGAGILIANCPYTLIGIMTTNHAIGAVAPEAASPDSRALIVKWGGLHAGRAILGFAATLAFLWASLG